MSVYPNLLNMHLPIDAPLEWPFRNLKLLYLGAVDQQKTDLAYMYLNEDWKSILLNDSALVSETNEEVKLWLVRIKDIVVIQ